MTVMASSTICVGPRPSSSGPSSQIVATASAGMVRPMLAMAEPSARLRLICTRLRRAALTAASVSGARTRMAMTTPTKDGGRPTADDGRPDRRREDLGQPDDGDERDEQQADAQLPRAPGRRVVALVVLEELAVLVDRQEELAVPPGLGEHEQDVEHQ